MATSPTRSPRSAETREKETRRKPWKPPAMLDTPEPEPGMRYRYLRAETLGEPDRMNMSKRAQEGFEIVHPDEINGHTPPTMSDGKHAGVVGVGGLVLAKIPEETANEREAYYRAQTNDQMQAIDNDLMKESNPVMPIGTPSRSTRVEFGNPDNKPTLDEKS